MITSNIPSLAIELQNRLPAMMADLEALVQMETPTGHKPAIDQAQDFLTERLEWAGARVERCTQSEAGDHLRAVWQSSNSPFRAPILALGHVDTVWPIGELEKQPFRQEDHYLFGPGIFDMKAGLINMIYAMKTLHSLNLPLSSDVIFIINTDEEVGSPTSRRLIEEEAMRSRYVLVMEPAFGENGLTVARKGVGRFTVTVRGRAAHAGREPQEGVNAIEELAHQILKLQALCDYERGTTVNVGVVEGGTRPNVVPAQAAAQVDLRVASATDGERLVQTILQLDSRNPRATVEVTGGLTRPPWDLNTACEALFHRARAIGLMLGMNLEKRISGGGSDGNFAAALGRPTLDGLGPEGAGAHAVGERVRVDSIVPRATLLAGLILDLANNGA